MVIHVEKDGAAALEEPPLTLAETVPLRCAFVLRFKNQNKFILSKLISWTKQNGMEQYSGKGIYEASCPTIIPKNVRKVILDLGNVQEIAELWVNGKPCGVRLWGPYRFEITEQAGDRIDRIRIAVTNSIANRISGASLDSGLLGPVQLQFYR